MARKSIEDQLRAARARLARLKPAEAHAAIQRGAILIDTRCGDDLQRFGTIPGAVHVPLSVLEWRVDPDSDKGDARLAQAERLILICNQGFASSLAAARLHDIGFTNATDVIGGFEAWRIAGMPIQESETR